MPKRTTPFRDGLLADLADPQEAEMYLAAAAEDSPEMASIAVRDVADAEAIAAPITVEVTRWGFSTPGEFTIAHLNTVIGAKFKYMTPEQVARQIAAKFAGLRPSEVSLIMPPDTFHQTSDEPSIAECVRLGLSLALRGVSVELLRGK